MDIARKSEVTVKDLKIGEKRYEVDAIAIRPDEANEANWIIEFDGLLLSVPASNITPK